MGNLVGNLLLLTERQRELYIGPRPANTKCEITRYIYTGSKQIAVASGYDYQLIKLSLHAYVCVYECELQFLRLMLS